MATLPVGALYQSQDKVVQTSTRISRHHVDHCWAFNYLIILVPGITRHKTDNKTSSHHLDPLVGRQEDGEVCRCSEKFQERAAAP